MVKPKKIQFTEALEKFLVSIWGGTKNYLDEYLIKKTRKALVEIRGIYRFRGDFPGKYPSAIRYKLKKNRAGYIAAFGQRHAYLLYAHLKMIEKIKPDTIPRPEDRRGELVVTTLGAGAAIELYGLCHYYNENSKILQKLHLNAIEKEDSWNSNRDTVREKVLKDIFPGLEITQREFNVDLTSNCVSKFAQEKEYDDLIKTDILIIYNVLNEMHVKYAKTIWRDIDFIIRNCERRLLILLMEPSVRKARARIDWLRIKLAQSSDVIIEKDEEEFIFNYKPIRIDFEGTGNGLNDRLFNIVLDGDRPPNFEKSLKRTHIACSVRQRSTISPEQMRRQLETIGYKREVSGKYTKQITPQYSFRDRFPDWDKI